jgi:hypothetical protein
MNRYTEEQLKRAFELGVTTAVEMSNVGTVDFNTPEWIHKTNMELFLWSELSWEKMKAWILDARWGREEENQPLIAFISGVPTGSRAVN